MQTAVTKSTRAMVQYIMLGTLRLLDQKKQTAIRLPGEGFSFKIYFKD